MSPSLLGALEPSAPQWSVLLAMTFQKQSESADVPVSISREAPSQGPPDGICGDTVLLHEPRNRSSQTPSSLLRAEPLSRH